MISRAVAFALPLAGATLLVATLAVVGARFRLLPPIAALALFSLALFGGGGLSLALGLVGALRGGGFEQATRGVAALAALIGFGCIALMVALIAGARDAPPIHDISTDVDDPPTFAAAAANPANRGRDLSYPHGAADTPRRQRDAYPEVAPIEVNLAADDAFEVAVQTARRLGWTVVARDPAAGTFEAEHETSVFRFVDDITVRVRPGAVGAVIDVRSTSRVGVSDMGVNAARIAAFRDALPTDRH